MAAGNDTGTSTAVTVIGLGVMGSALATALLRGGHPTTVWNRTTSKADALIASGAKPASSVGEAVSASPVVIVCLLDDDIALTHLDGASTAIAGRTLVNLTTSTPAQARRIAAWAAAHDIDYLDGGIMATPEMIGGPDASVLYSGSPSALDAARPALERFGNVDYVGGDPGLASLYDLALLSGMYGMVGGWFQALALVGSAGISAIEFVERLGPFMTAMASELPAIARQLDEHDRAPDAAPMATHTSALTNIIATNDQQGVKPQLLAPLRDLFEQATDADAVNLAELVEMLARPAT